MNAFTKSSIFCLCFYSMAASADVPSYDRQRYRIYKIDESLSTLSAPAISDVPQAAKNNSNKTQVSGYIVVANRTTNQGLYRYSVFENTSIELPPFYTVEAADALPTSQTEVYEVSRNSPPSINALGEVGFAAGAFTPDLNRNDLGFRIFLGNQILGTSQGNFAGCGDPLDRINGHGEVITSQSSSETGVVYTVALVKEHSSGSIALRRYGLGVIYQSRSRVNPNDPDSPLVPPVAIECVFDQNATLSFINPGVNNYGDVVYLKKNGGLHQLKHWNAGNDCPIGSGNKLCTLLSTGSNDFRELTSVAIGSDREVGLKARSQRGSESGHTLWKIKVPSGNRTLVYQGHPIDPDAIFALSENADISFANVPKMEGLPGEREGAILGVGSLRIGGTGLYLFKQGKEPIEVAASGDGLPGEPFDGPGAFGRSINSSGQIVFIGTTAQGKTGVYLAIPKDGQQ